MNVLALCNEADSGFFLFTDHIKRIEWKESTMWTDGVT
jgi:hypothetical protein